MTVRDAHLMQTTIYWKYPCCLVTLCIMERIVLEVDGNIAAKWKQASAEKRSKVLAFLNNALDLIDEPTANGGVNKGYALPSERKVRRHDERVQNKTPEYLKFLDEMGEIAAKNGLTQQALDELLAEDE